LSIASRCHANDVMGAEPLALRVEGGAPLHHEANGRIALDGP
jgi:hypothetical protein